MSPGVYDGPAVLTLGGQTRDVRVRLTGHLDPIDGRYHWQGTVFDTLPDDALKRSTIVSLTIDGNTAAARIVERTPWDTHSIADVGAPPYRLDAIREVI
ncbi:DUF4873 domain-containing protein [Mycolicibacterium komossense]|uniref:DUF4873 domain-containing protein n=1 Tax=Mycolicibacterium komossense TaxID=1779 RepID=A0ABT3CE12_9MYCO|nr:DUF4873 domain-containing protein [Mycolicibacterium komossense]